MDGFVCGIFMPIFKKLEGVMFYEKEYKSQIYKYKN